MNKVELVASVASKAEITKKQSEVVVNAVLESIQEALGRGEDVKLVGYFNLECKERKSRIGRNPKTGEEIQIPSTKVVKFKAGKLLKDAVLGVSNE